MKEWRIAKSFFRDNKGFSFGLLLMFVISIIVCFLGVFLPYSVINSLNNYTEGYNLADAWITVAPGMDFPIDEIEDLENIVCVDASFAGDTDIKINGEEGFSARIFTVSKDSRQRFHSYEGNNENFDSFGVSQRFARFHNLSPGDTITVNTPSGEKDYSVGSIITTPESVICSRDELSANDMYEFCYLYINEDEAENIFGYKGLINRFSLYFEDGTSVDDIEDSVKEAEKILGDSVITSVVYESSQLKSSIDSEMNGLSGSINYLFKILFGIGIGLAAFFIYQVVGKERSNIGILSALGYSKSKLFGVLMRYVGFLAFLGIVIGIPLGFVVIKSCTGVYLNEFSIPEVVLSCKTNAIAVYLMIYIVAVFAISLISIGRITVVDPCEAYGGVKQSDAELPKWLSKLHISVFSKNVIGHLIKNKRRLLLTSLCIAASIVMLMMNYSTKASNRRTIPANFGERFLYDLYLRTDGSLETYESIANNEYTEKVNEYIAFKEEISFGDKVKTMQINTIKDDTDLLCIYDNNGNRLYPGDGIILDKWFADTMGIESGDKVKLGELELEVTGIAYEYMDSMQYISLETAEKLGYSKANTLLVKLYDNSLETEALMEYKEEPGVFFGSLSSSCKKFSEDSFAALGVAFDVFAFLGVFLGLIIIYNMVVLNASEKKHEYATLLALGIWNKEILSMAFTENIIEYVISVIFAIPFGISGAIGLMNSMSTQGHSYLPYHMGVGMVTVCVFSLIYILAGVFISIWKIKKIDPALSLNFDE